MIVDPAPGTFDFQVCAHAELAARTGGPRCICGKSVDAAYLPATGYVSACVSGEHVTVRQGDDVKVYVHVENPEDVMFTAAHAATCARRQIETTGPPGPECDCGGGEA